MILRPLPLNRFLALVAVVFALAWAGSLALPHDSYIRYQSFEGTIFDRLTWVYERIHFDETPIDVAFIGSSRSASGAIAPYLEAELAARGHDLRVVNFSIPASGLDVRDTIVRDLLARKKVRLIVLGVVEALPRDGHQAFGDLGTAGEILTSPLIVNRNLPRNLLRLPVRQITLAMATAAPGAFGYRRVFDQGTYRGASIDVRPYGGWTLARDEALRADPSHARTMAAEARDRRREITPPLLPDALAWVEFGVSRSYVRRIAAAAASHDAEVAFLFMPFFEGFDAPRESAWFERFGPVWAASFVKDNASNFRDAAHVSDSGARLVTPWLADRVLEALESTTHAVRATAP